MKNLNKLLTLQIKTIPVSLTIVILIVGLLGFADSVYLSIEHFLGRIPPCSVVTGCESVLTSQYSTLAGIPTAFFGVIYYLTILMATFAYFESKNTKFLKWAIFFTPVGFIFSLWFLYLQAFVLKAFCTYCLGSAITSTILFALALIVLANFRQNENITNTNN